MRALDNCAVVGSGVPREHVPQTTSEIRRHGRQGKCDAQNTLTPAKKRGVIAGLVPATPLRQARRDSFGIGGERAARATAARLFPALGHAESFDVRELHCKLDAERIA